MGAMPGCWWHHVHREPSVLRHPPSQTSRAPLQAFPIVLPPLLSPPPPHPIPPLQISHIMCIAAPSHLCPVDLRKLQHSCGFNVEARYRALLEVYRQLPCFSAEQTFVANRLAALGS